MAKRGWRGARVAGLAVMLSWFCTSGSSDAQTAPSPTTDTPAGYLVFPKIVVDTLGVCPDGSDCSRDGTCANAQPCEKTDTVIQLTNVAGYARSVHCSYVDGSEWRVRNGGLDLTPKQPAAWNASTGVDVRGTGAKKLPPLGPRFTGELKCVQSDPQDVAVPTRAHDLNGKATIIRVAGGPSGRVDASSYNAIGFRPKEVSPKEPPDIMLSSLKCQGGTNAGGACTRPGSSSDPACPGGTCGVTMCLGATANSRECATANYGGCATILILNHFFDQEVSQPFTTTRLTLVPCSEDLPLDPAVLPPSTVVQLLVFNEFEQRLSSSMRLNCYREVQLSDIDSPGAHRFSMFNYAVQGTLVGQTRMRPVLGPDTTTGHGVLAVAEEFHGSQSAAFNLNEQGSDELRNKGDFVRYVPSF